MRQNLKPSQLLTWCNTWTQSTITRNAWRVSPFWNNESRGDILLISSLCFCVGTQLFRPIQHVHSVCEGCQNQQAWLFDTVDPAALLMNPAQHSQQSLPPASTPPPVDKHTSAKQMCSWQFWISMSTQTAWPAAALTCSPGNPAGPW